MSLAKQAGKWGAVLAKACRELVLGPKRYRRNILLRVCIVGCPMSAVLGVALGVMLRVKSKDGSWLYLPNEAMDCEIGLGMDYT